MERFFLAELELFDLLGYLASIRRTSGYAAMWVSNSISCAWLGWATNQKARLARGFICETCMQW